MKVIINILFLFCEPFLDNVRIRHADHLPILSLLDHVLPPDIGWQGSLDVFPRADMTICGALRCPTEALNLQAARPQTGLKDKKIFDTHLTN